MSDLGAGRAWIIFPALVVLAGCSGEPGALGADTGTGQADVPPSSELVLNMDLTWCQQQPIQAAVGQSFQVTRPMDLDHLDLVLDPSEMGPTSYHVEVYDGEGTGGAKLATSALVSMLQGKPGIGQDPETTRWLEFAFAPRVSLLANHAYTFRLVSLGKFRGNFRECEEGPTTGSEYLDGLAQNKDVAFRLHATLGPSPCAAWRHTHPDAGDGEYTLAVQGRPASIYCHDMATHPTEYLSLVHTGGSYNTSYYGKGGNSPNGLTTWFTRVRLQPYTLTVDQHDTTFATSSGSKQFDVDTYTANNYAEAADCTGPNSMTGRANVDLRGTPFALVPGQLNTEGAAAEGSIEYSSDGQDVNLTGGGICGFTHVGNKVLALSWTTPGDLGAECSADNQCQSGRCGDGRCCSGDGLCPNEDHSGCRAAPGKAARGGGWLVAALVAARARRRRGSNELS